MANALRNAGAADGLEGWNATGGSPDFSVDEDHYGAPGKALFLSSGTAPADNQSTLIQADDDNRVDCAPGDTVEAFAFHYASKGEGQLRVLFEKTDGTVLETNSLAVTHAGNQSPELGAWSTFDWTYAAVGPAPNQTAKARLQFKTVVPTSGQAFRLMLLHPYLALPGELSPAKWDPGSHENADLDLAIWPDDVPRFLSDNESNPYANRSTTDTDSNIPTGRLLYLTPQFSFRGRMRCLDLHLARLEAFHQRGLAEFWIERPDTRQLCVAKWLADGAPKKVGSKGPWLIVEVGLHLRVA